MPASQSGKSTRVRPHVWFTVAWCALAACGGETLGEANPAVVASEARESGAALSVAPNPVAARATLRVSGCGYSPTSPVTAQDSGPAGTRSWNVQPDASGCVALTVAAGSDAGAHTLKTYQQLKRGRATLVAQAGFTVTPAPLAVTSEQYYFRWDATKACVGEDDTLDWSASGYLAPGESFTFTPKHPDCSDPRAVMVKVAAEAGATIRISTVVPENDYLSNDFTQQGKTIAASMAGGVARLCMFPNTSFGAPAGYTITVTNVGTTTASSVTVQGKDYNDWPYFYWNECLAADADGDGWSDSYEHTLAQLVYPTGNFSSGALPAGTDYLRACGTAAANDEFDAWPLDLDDNGAVTQADVDAVTAHLGEGNGVPWSAITPNPGVAENFWNHVGDWNRFDLDADGWVNDSDVARIRAALGARCGE